MIHVLEPRSDQEPSLWRRARVSMPPGSEPWFGSVRPKQPTRRPAASSGRYRRLCSSEPKAWIGSMTRLDWTLIALRYAESTRSTSFAMSP